MIIRLKNFLNFIYLFVLCIYLSGLLCNNFMITHANAADASDNEIKYIEILQNPKDLDLNLKYAQQQGKAGNFKQTISTLERLIMLYPDNIESKYSLISIFSG